MRSTGHEVGTTHAGVWLKELIDVWGNGQVAGSPQRMGTPLAMNMGKMEYTHLLMCLLDWSWACNVGEEMLMAADGLCR